MIIQFKMAASEQKRTEEHGFPYLAVLRPLLRLLVSMQRPPEVHDCMRRLEVA